MNARGAVPVVGIILMVGVGILLAGGVGIFVQTLTDSATTEEPNFSAVGISSVEASNEDILVPALEEGDQCEYYHVVITIDHGGGDPFTSEDLQYQVEVSGSDETLSGAFTSEDVNPGETVSAGEQVVIALDSDTDPCGGSPEDSENAIVFDGEPAWFPEDVGQAGDLYDIHNTFLEDGSPDDLEAIEVQIIHEPTDTIIVDERTTDIDDDSP